MSSSSVPPIFGRYKVQRLLGRGAVGQVYLAEDPALSRQVAVKTLSGLDALPAAEQEETRERFLREARAAAGLNHPNIVTIFDVGEHEGLPYIAMEYLRGITLDRYATEGHLLPVQKVLEIGIQAAMALDEAHRSAIIHRDIKPANMVLLEDGSLKVADFGLAKDVRSSLTATQTLLGTPNYMAPEQIAGRPLDGRADLFALAVTLFELLTGKRPFTGDTVSSVLYRIVNESPTPLSEFKEDLPDSLGSFFDSALAKDPNQRPRRGADFAQRLNQVLAEMGGMPANITIPPPAEVESTPSRAQQARSSSKPGKRKPRVALRTLVAFLVLLAVVAGSWTMPLWMGEDPLGSHRRDVEDWLSANLGAVGDAVRITAPEIVFPVFTNPGQLAVRVLSVGLTLDPQGRLHVPGDRVEPVLLEIADPCYHGKRTVDPSEFAGPVTLEALPKMANVRLESDPSGARVVLDTKRIEQTTPTELSLRLCQSHVLELSAKSRQPVQIQLEKSETADPWVEQLANVSLAPPEMGTLEIPAAKKGYPVAVFDRRGRRLGKAGARLRLAPGTHRLVLRSSKVLFRREIREAIQSSQLTRARVNYPALGTLRVFSIPADASVTVTPSGGGKPESIGATPITGYKMVEGEVEIAVENPSTGAVYRATVRIRPGTETTDLRVGRGDWK